MKILDLLILTVVVIGGLNWGLVGLFDFNLVTTLFGDASLISRTVYIVVGLAALYLGATTIAKKMK